MNFLKLLEFLMIDDENIQPLTEEYLRHSILTSYPASTLELFRELRPNEWARHFGDLEPSGQQHSIKPKLILIPSQNGVSEHLSH